MTEAISRRCFQSVHPIAAMCALALVATFAFADGIPRRTTRKRAVRPTVGPATVSGETAEGAEQGAELITEPEPEPPWYESYRQPERGWILSGVWAVGGTEFDEYYHDFHCPLLRQFAEKFPGKIVGWRSATDALGVGRKPHPECKAPDPTKTVPGQIRTLLQKSAQLFTLSDQMASTGFINQAAQYQQAAWIARGDALLLAADAEKKAGRLVSARLLYNSAATAYQTATGTAARITPPRAALPDLGAVGLPSSVSGAAATAQRGVSGYNLSGQMGMASMTGMMGAF